MDLPEPDFMGTGAAPGKFSTGWMG